MARRSRTTAIVSSGKRALAMLNHPNIVTIHEIGHADGTPFLVLEWIGGGALCDQPFRRPMSMQDFLRVSLPIADALGAAHDRGIVHRDLKPTNVLVGQEGRIKLADFGLATFRELDGDATRTAGAIGTVAYMSPEQASGGSVGPASDVFAFRILAYELLAGRRPFGGPAPGAVIAAIVSQTQPPLSDVRSELPAALVDLVQRCLEKQPERRFRTGLIAKRHALFPHRYGGHHQGHLPRSPAFSIRRAPRRHGPRRTRAAGERGLRGSGRCEEELPARERYTFPLPSCPFPRRGLLQ